VKTLAAAHWPQQKQREKIALGQSTAARTETDFTAATAAMIRLEKERIGGTHTSAPQRETTKGGLATILPNREGIEAMRELHVQDNNISVIAVSLC
jgi:hypothetical protein